MSAGHTVTIRPSTDHVEITVGGTTVATSDRPLLLDETGLPTRYYLPKDDVRMELFRATSFTTHCPFKGDASYWTLDLDGVTHDGIVWGYEDPLPNAAAIAGYLCFYPDRVDLAITPAD